MKPRYWIFGLVGLMVVFASVIWLTSLSKNKARSTEDSIATKKEIPEWKRSGTSYSKRYRKKVEELTRPPSIQENPRESEHESQQTTPVIDDLQEATTLTDKLAGMTNEERRRYVWNLPEFKKLLAQVDALGEIKRQILDEYLIYEQKSYELIKGEANLPKVLTDKDMKILKSMRDDGIISQADYQRFYQMYEKREENNRECKGL